MERFTISHPPIPSGTIVRRHRIPFTYDSSRPKPSSRTHPARHITFYDLNVSGDINVYGRVSEFPINDVWSGLGAILK